MLPETESTFIAAAAAAAVAIGLLVWWIASITTANKDALAAKAIILGAKELATAVHTEQATRFRPSHWMEDLASAISDRSLQELALPGSHNSGAYSLTSTPAPGAPSVCWAIPSFIGRWSVCQDRPVDEQLRAGARYLDLRTASVGEGEVQSADELVVVHGMVGVGTLEVLRQVKAFLDATSLELVVLDFQHFHRLTIAEHELLLDSIRHLFGAEAITPPAEARAPLSELWAKRRRVVLLCGDAAFAPTRPELVLERPSSISSPWAGNGQTRDAAARCALKAKLERYMVRAPDLTSAAEC